MARLPAAIAALLAFAGGAAAVVHIHVDAGEALATTLDQFVCWNIDASANRGFFERDLNVSKPYGKQLAYQAAKMVARQGMGTNRLSASLRFAIDHCPSNTWGHMAWPLVRCSGRADAAWSRETDHA